MELTLDELRSVAGFAVACARIVLPLFEEILPDDDRPRAAMAAAGAGYLHPLAEATQVRHVLGAGAHAIRARELRGAELRVEAVVDLAAPVVGTVLRRFPPAPPGGGRVGELVRELDDAVRAVGR